MYKLSWSQMMFLTLRKKYLFIFFLNQNILKGLSVSCGKRFLWIQQDFLNLSRVNPGWILTSVPKPKVVLFLRSQKKNFRLENLLRNPECRWCIKHLLSLHFECCSSIYYLCILLFLWVLCLIERCCCIDTNKCEYAQCMYIFVLNRWSNTLPTLCHWHKKI